MVSFYWVGMCNALWNVIVSVTIQMLKFDITL